MKKFVAAAAVAAGAMLVAPGIADAGMIRIATLSCSTGITLTWADPHDTDPNLNNPPRDVYTMIIESVRANGVPVGVHTVDGLNAVMDPISATGVVTIDITVHWHIERPDGTSTNSPSVPRQGTVTCNAVPATTIPPATSPATTAPGTPTIPPPASTIVSETTSSVASGGVTVPPTIAPTTTRVMTDITLPETGRDTGGSTVLATILLITGAGAFLIARRRTA